MNKIMYTFKCFSSILRSGFVFTPVYKKINHKVVCKLCTRLSQKDVESNRLENCIREVYFLQAAANGWPS